MPKGMYKITNYDELYRPYDKSGGELKHASFVKLPVKQKGDGLQVLLEQKRGLEVFAIWCLLLEKTTSEKPKNRGKLLNHKEEPATVEEIAKSINLSNKIQLVEHALKVLIEMKWIDVSTPAELTSAKSELTSAQAEQIPTKRTKGNLTKYKHKEQQLYISNKVYKDLKDYLQRVNVGKNMSTLALKTFKRYGEAKIKKAFEASNRSTMPLAAFWGSLKDKKIKK